MKEKWGEKGGTEKERGKRLEIDFDFRFKGIKAPACYLTSLQQIKAVQFGKIVIRVSYRIISIRSYNKPFFPFVTSACEMQLTIDQ